MWLRCCEKAMEVKQNTFEDGQTKVEESWPLISTGLSEVLLLHGPMSLEEDIVC